MRCKACNKLLNDFELMKVDSATGNPLDLCGRCLGESNKAMSNWSTDVDTTYDGLDDLLIPYDEEIMLDKID